jgi:DNA-binding CsgD family transcriptional regulator
MMGVTSSVFVGRQVELDLVSSALEESRASRPQVVSIEGEPGIGKSAFLRRVLSNADDVVVLDASGDENETALDYGVLAQLASKAATEVSTQALTDRIDDPTAASAFSVGAELLDLLGSLQEKAAVVVAVDDAHLMDPPSASALLFALRRLRADRVLVLLASRSQEIERLGPSWLRLLGDPDRAQRVRLSGLTTRDVSLLAGSLGFGAWTFSAAERLREHTSGHPLYVKALLSELPPDAFAFDGPLPAPHSYAATVIARLTSVAPDTQDLVAAAAVVGNRCPLTLAGALAGVGDPLTAVEDAIAADLLALVPTRFPEEVTFPHPLVRAAVYDDLSPSVRRRLHLACAELTSGSASLPHRVAASAGSDDALAAELSASADDQEAHGNLTAAAERLLSASRIAASSEAREDALLRGVEHLLHAGEFPRAVGLLDAVLSCADGPRRSYVLGILTASLGQVAEGEAALRELAQHPDFGSDPGLAGSVIASLAVLCAVQGNGEEAVNWARQAGQAKSLSPTAKVIATEGLAWGLSVLGRGTEATALFDGLSPARIRPKPFEAELLTVRGIGKSWWGDPVGAVEDLSAVIRWSREGARLRSLPNAFGALAEAEYHVGRWSDALTHAEVAVSLGEDSDRIWDLPFVHAVASYLHADRGNRQFANEHADAARRAAEVTPAPLGRYYACVAAGHLAWVHEDWSTVLDALAPLHTPPRPIPMTGLERVPWLLEAEAMIRTGRLDEGEHTLSRLRDAADESSQGVIGVDLCRLFGVLEHARGRLEQARAAFVEGEAAAEAAGSPFAHGTLELAHGRFLHKTGSRRAAIAALRLAREAFERLDARPFLERCDAELAACGVRAQHNGADDDYGLTAREQVVARLVASGKSNREVAAELYLSSKAIEYHLANIFTKVGITSRHQLAARIAR